MINTIDLSRAQFAFTIAFHIIFPAFSIGLATFLLIIEACYLKTKNPLYYRICKFWMKIFALTFGMGVVSGLVMEIQLGANWSVFSREVGPVLGALFTYEVLTAFFIEAGFLGIMLFGWEKVGAKLHFVATLMVCIGVTVSAFWILAANSWMQTPAGATLYHHHFVVQSWSQVILNHSTIIRFVHMLIACYLTTAFVIAGISSYFLLKNKHIDFAKKCFSISLWLALILAPTQVLIGDAVGLVVHEYQPMKTAAIEANWKTQNGAPLVLFAYPNQKLQKNEYSIIIPKLASLINTHKLNGRLEGLGAVPIKDQPVVIAVFYSFRVMVAIGLAMMFLAIIGLCLRRNQNLYKAQWFHKLCFYFSPMGFLAIITGWITAECGRQPWVVYHLLRTKDAVSPVSVEHVVITMMMIFVVYFMIFGFFYPLYLRKIIHIGPILDDAVEHPFGYMEHSLREDG